MPTRTFECLHPDEVHLSWMPKLSLFVLGNVLDIARPLWLLHRHLRWTSTGHRTSASSTSVPLHALGVSRTRAGKARPFRSKIGGAAANSGSSGSPYLQSWEAAASAR